MVFFLCFLALQHIMPGTANTVPIHPSGTQSTQGISGMGTPTPQQTAPHSQTSNNIGTSVSDGQQVQSQNYYPSNNTDGNVGNEAQIQGNLSELYIISYF